MSDLKDIRIIFSDIDGTLLPFEGKDLSRTVKLLKDLMEAGYIFVPCTGRGTGNLPKEILSLPGLRYVITANGALVTDLETGEPVYKKVVSRKLAEEITKTLRPFTGHAYLYRHGVHHLDVTGEWMMGPVSGTLKDWVDSAIRTDFLKLLEKEGWKEVDKMGLACLDPAVQKEAVQALSEQSWYPELIVSSSAYWNIEINAKGASKGLAALWLASHLGFSPDQMLTAGDNYNDLSMLQAGGISVAPLNAVPEVREAATVVVPDCKEDGVENYLEQLLR